MDDAALKVLQAAEDTKQILAEKEEVLAGIRQEFERKNKEVGLCWLHAVLADVLESHICANDVGALAHIQSVCVCLLCQYTCYTEQLYPISIRLYSIALCPFLWKSTVHNTPCVYL